MLEFYRTVFMVNHTITEFCYAVGPKEFIKIVNSTKQQIIKNLPIDLLPKDIRTKQNEIYKSEFMDTRKKILMKHDLFLEN